MSETESKYGQPVLRDPNDPDFRWYLVQTHSNCEAKAISNIEVNLELRNKKNTVKNLLFPSIETTTQRNGKKVKKTIKLFPSYILIFAKMDTDLFSLITRTNKVAGFLNKIETRNLPTPMTDKEVENMFKNLEDYQNNVDDIANVKLHDQVRILDGTFADMTGIVKKLNASEDMVVVGVKILGTETDVKLSLKSVEQYIEK